MKKRDPEITEALGLKKEYDMFIKNASRPGAPKIESDYYHSMAQRTASGINWKHLEKKKKKEERDNYDS